MYKKRSVYTSGTGFICLILSMSLMASDSHEAEQKATCCDVSSISALVYHVGKRFGRNDFLYLAHAGSLWWLRKKFEMREDCDDFDKHHLRHGKIVGGINISPYYTPLHEAIRMGNFQVVQALLDRGADIHKKIISKDDTNIDWDGDGAIAPADYGVGYFEKYDPDATEQEISDSIAVAKKSWFIGYSGFELAQEKVRAVSDDEDDAKLAERQAILNLLKKKLE